MALEKLVKQPLRKIPMPIRVLGAGVLAYFSLASAVKADTITGKVESVPSLTAPKKAKITFTDVFSGTPYIASIDSLTGAFSTDVPAGSYERKIEADNNFVFLDTLNIAGSTAMDSLQTIENLPISSTYFTNVLGEVKNLTKTQDANLDKEMERWYNSDQPINVFANNDSMPPDLRQCYDFAVTQINAKSNNKVQFNETSATNAIGINFVYLNNSQMTLPGANGYTVIEELYPDTTPKKIRIEINKEIVDSTWGNPVFLREFMRALCTFDASPDPSFVMYTGGGASNLHDDEGKVLQIMYTLNNQTNMFKHKNIVYTGVEGAPAETINPVKTFAITSTYPNPARSYANICYNLPYNEKTTVSLYNVTGQKVAEQECPAGPGQNAVRFNLAAYPSGVYIYRISARSQTATGKFVISR